MNYVAWPFNEILRQYEERIDADYAASLHPYAEEPWQIDCEVCHRADATTLCDYCGAALCPADAHHVDGTIRCATCEADREEASHATD